ncbi:MAG TPA: 30S ribosomal protein S8 [Clostridiaceae bacterium]|nr:30S ribosomal protein S8 [Clostridiaceae bacterium]
MQITDTIADMLTRIRNAGRAGHTNCDIPASKMKKAIADILVEEGYIQSVTFQDDNKQGILTVTLKYIDKKPVINGIQRISKPGLRVYADMENLPKVLGGLGIAIISTSQGIKTDRQARKDGVGGEVLAYVW